MSCLYASLLIRPLVSSREASLLIRPLVSSREASLLIRPLVSSREASLLIRPLVSLPQRYDKRELHCYYVVVYTITMRHIDFTLVFSSVTL
jgi:hypothetical protein